MLDRYRGRLSDRIMTKITGAAAAGQWEKAIHWLVTALSIHAEAITADERQELRAVLTAMHMPGHRADALPQRH